MSGTVHAERLPGHVFLLTIDNPPMNALGEPLRAVFLGALDQAAQDADVRAIVVTGSGKAFCAGDDLKHDKGVGNDSPASFPRLLTRIEESRVPVIAAVNGWCVGGGFELALACDLRIASTAARFTCAGVNMGLMTSAYRLPRLIGVSRAKAMLLTGSAFDAETAERFGLVTGLFGPDVLLDEALTLARRIASRAPLSVEASKQVADRAVDMDPEEAAQMQRPILKALRASADHQEAVAAFREKRDPVFTRS